MLIYEKQGVVCVDGLVLGGSETHFGNCDRSSKSDLNVKSKKSRHEPFLAESWLFERAVTLRLSWVQPL